MPAKNQSSTHQPTAMTRGKTPPKMITLVTGWSTLSYAPTTIFTRAASWVVAALLPDLKSSGR